MMADCINSAEHAYHDTKLSMHQLHAIICMHTNTDDHTALMYIAQLFVWETLLQ